MKLILLLILLLFAALALHPTEPHAEEYKNLSPEFLSALDKITSDYFFTADIYASSAFNDPRNKNFRKYIELHEMDNIYVKHLDELTKKVCAPISKEIQGLMAQERVGEDAYDFLQDVSASMMARGAYVLPLRLTKAKISAHYFNPVWEKSRDLSLGGNRYLANYVELIPDADLSGYAKGAIKYRDGGIIEVSSSYFGGYDSDSYIQFPELHELITKEVRFQARDFLGNFDFISTYLFVLKDNDPANQEVIYLYVDIPFQITMSKYQDPDSIVLRSNKEGLNCYPASLNYVRWQGKQYPNFREGKLQLTPMVTPEPLTSPLGDNYKQRKFPYKISNKSIALPSLQCWMTLHHYDAVSGKDCNDVMYGDQFFKMMNEDVCVGKEEVKKIPMMSDIFEYSPQGRIDAYKKPIFNTTERCR